MLESWGCGLYTSAAYTRVFTVCKRISVVFRWVFSQECLERIISWVSSFNAHSVYWSVTKGVLLNTEMEGNEPEWGGMDWNEPEWHRNDTGMDRNGPEWTGMTPEWTGIDSFYACLKELFWKKNIVWIFFKSIWRGIKCAVTKTLLIILHSLTPSLPPMHPFCSEATTLVRGRGPRYVELVVKSYTMEIDSI